MNHIAKIQNALAEHEIDAMLLTGAINRRWATGFSASAGALVITAGECVFITDSRYIENAKATIKGAKVVQIDIGQSYTDLIGKTLERNNVKTLGFEEDVMTQGVYTSYAKKLGVTLKPAQDLIDTLRLSKSAEERDYIKKSQEITDKTFTQILSIITPDMTERELAAEIIYRLLKNGGEKTSFDPIVLSGSRSSSPHGSPGEHKLEGFVILDFGTVYKGYCSDMTRTIAIGQVTDEMKRVYETVLEAQLAGIKVARAGVIGKEIDQAARDVIGQAGYGDYFGHGFGHSIGLEIHETPNSLRANPIEERAFPKGSVISAEPGIYLPGKFGVRIEDLLYLTETGNENLTSSTKDLIIL